MQVTLATTNSFLEPITETKVRLKFSIRPIDEPISTCVFTFATNALWPLSCTRINFVFRFLLSAFRLPRPWSMSPEPIVLDPW